MATATDEELGIEKLNNKASPRSLVMRGNAEEEEDLASEIENDVGRPESTLLYHLEQKYLCDGEEEHTSTMGGSVGSPGSNSNDPFIDIFGTSPCWLASRRGLELVVLNHTGITQVGDASKFAAHAKHITQLDLGWNQLAKWSEIANLLSALPELRSLNLQHNPIEASIPKWEMQSSRASKKRTLSGRGLTCPGPYRDPGASLPISWKLNTLILNGVQMPLATLRTLLATMPRLNELHLSGNRRLFSSLSARESRVGEKAGNNGGGNSSCGTGAISESVAHLHLFDVGLEEWAQLREFIHHFPATSNLSVAENPLRSIDSAKNAESSVAQSSSLLAKLKTLNASHTLLRDWSSIEALEAVKELRLRHIPLLERYSEEARFHLVVARLPALRWLNGSEITSAQRDESERFFIRHYNGGNTYEEEDEKEGCSTEDSPPPIYHRLLAKHGRLEPLVKIDLTPKRSAKVWLRYHRATSSAAIATAPASDNDAVIKGGGESSATIAASPTSSSAASMVRESMHVRLSSTVQQLMRHAAKLSGIPTRQMRIFHYYAGWVDVEGGGYDPTELRLPNQRLHSLHVDDGDEFLVQAKMA